MDLQNSAYIFVFYWPVDPPRRFLPSMFSIHSRDIKMLVDGGYIRREGDSQKHTLSVVYRSIPYTKRDEYIQNLRAHGLVTEELAKKLASELPELFQRNWNAHEYYKFERNPRTKDWPHLVERGVWDLVADFSRFPYFPRLKVEDRMPNRALHPTALPAGAGKVPSVRYAHSGGG